MKKLLSAAFALLCVAALTLSMMADCTPIDQPDADYQGGTGKCTMGDQVLFSTTTTCKDQVGPTGLTLATFSNPLSVRQVPNGWASWSTPPDAESSTPWVGFNQTLTLTVTLADGAESNTAGMEIENNQFKPTLPVKVSFQDADGNELTSVTRDVLGRAGARLFAVTCDDAIKSMVVTSDPAAQGFAIAQVRGDGFVVADSGDEITTKPMEPREGATSNIQ